MSVSYDRVNWADYPATTTPVNATNLNKMDKGIADLTSEVNSVESSVSNLNNSLTASDNLKFRFATDGEGNYGYLDGDDTFVPFSNGSIDTACTAYVFSSANAPSLAMTKDTVYSLSGYNGAGLVNAVSEGLLDCLSRVYIYDGGTNTYAVQWTVAKAGYYSISSTLDYCCKTTPQYCNIGDILTYPGSYNGNYLSLVYWGTTEPTFVNR